MTIGNFNNSGLLPNLSIIMNTDLTNIPTDFTQVATLDGKYLKGIPTAVTDPDSNIGSSTHTHTLDGDHGHVGTVSSHTHSATHSSPVGIRSTEIESGGASDENHTHPLTGSSSSLASITTDGSHTHNSFTNDLEHRTISFYKKDDTITNMSTKALPSNITLFYSKTGTFPDGFLENLNFVDKHFKGDPTPNTEAGSNLHQHDSINHLHTLDIGAHEHTYTFGNASVNANAGTSVEFDNPSTTHSHSTNTAGTINKSSTPQDSGDSVTHDHDDISHESSFKTLRLLTTSSVSMSKAGVPRNCLLLWLDLISQIPNGWQVSDGTNNTINMLNMYPKGNATPDITGGSDTHTHSEDTISHSHTGQSISHTHDGTGSSGTASSTPAGLTGGPTLSPIADDHSHSITSVTSQSAQAITVTDNSSNHDHGSISNDPDSKTIAFIERVN